MATAEELPCGCVVMEHQEYRSVVRQCGELTSMANRYFDKMDADLMQIPNIERSVEFARGRVKNFEKKVDEHLGRQEGRMVAWRGETWPKS